MRLKISYLVVSEATASLITSSISFEAEIPLFLQKAWNCLTRGLSKYNTTRPRSERSRALTFSMVFLISNGIKIKNTHSYHMFVDAITMLPYTMAYSILNICGQS